MSSLNMMDPRRRYAEILAEQNDISWMIQKNHQRNQMMLAGCIIGGILLLAAIFWTGVERESARVDEQTQTWRLQGYPIPR